MNKLTSFTTHIGNILAEIKQKNKLIEEAKKTYNPSFIEIIEELEKDDKTLCNMLVLWYGQKYLDNPIDIDDIMTSIKPKKKKETIYYDYSCGCGSLSSLSGC